MQRHKFTLCLPALLLSFQLSYPIFCQSATAEAAKTGTATVSGRVTLNGEPAPDVAVALQPDGLDPPVNLSIVLRAKADENGRFRFIGVTAGRHFITALAPGFTASNLNIYGEMGKPISVTDGENVEDVAIELKRGGVITGRVTDEQGRTLTDQKVKITPLGRDGARRFYYGISSHETSDDMGVIDDRGVYRVYGLPEGRYLVSVGVAPASGPTLQSSGVFYPRTFHPDAATESEAKAIEIAEGSENTGVDIVVGGIKKTHGIAGRVVNADTGQPVAGAELVYATLWEGGQLGGYGDKSERSDAKGAFRLAGVLPGKYVVFVRSEAESDFYGELATCDVSSGDVEGLEVKVRQGASISGVALIEGSNDPAVLSKLSQIQLYPFVKTSQASAPGKGLIKINADGRFHIRGLRPGKVDIRIDTDMKELSRLRVEHNGAPQRDGIEVGPGEQVTNVRVVIGYGAGVLRGQVKITGGEFPQDLKVNVYPRRVEDPSMMTRGGVVDARGQFLIEGLLPGEYQLNVYVTSRVRGDSRVAQYGPLFSKIKDRVVVSNGSEARVSLVVDLSQREENK